MVSYSITNSFNQNWSFLLNDCFSSSLCCMINCEKIISINSDCLHSICNSSCCYAISSILLINWCWDGEQIVSAVKQRLCSKCSREIHCWVKIALWSRPISKVSYCNSILIVDSIFIPCSWTLRNLCSQRWGDCDNIEFLWSIMHRHLSPLSKIKMITCQLICHVSNGKTSP